MKIFKLFFYFLFFILIIVLTLPKENLYYLFEKELKKHNIIFSNEKIKESSFALKLSSLDVSFNKIPLSKIKEIDFNFLILYNSLEINSIFIKEGFSPILPSQIDSVYFSYSIFTPLTLNVKANGNFGKLIGRFSLSSNRLKLELIESTLMQVKYKNILRKMKKEKKGYSYEYQL